MTKNIDPRPVGPAVDPKPPGNLPDLRPIHGRWVRLDALDADRHSKALWEAINGKDPDGALWTYMAFGPFADEEALTKFNREKQASKDAWFYAYVNKASGKAQGMGSFMRADAANGAIEIGSIWMAPVLQRTREATEAIYLMMRHAFDELGVRRLEWKCDALNAPSRKAADRFGFTFEGIFRQHFIIKGRNRDTAWYSIIDKEWPAIRKNFEAWLAEPNFDESGKEKAKLQVR